MKTIFGRYQLVWWWHPEDWHWYVGREGSFGCGLGPIYKWRLGLGPLEIRRWV